jgi:hypothetical protein
MQSISPRKNINDQLTEAYLTINVVTTQCVVEQSTLIAQGYKHDLLKLLWHLQDSIANCPDFGEAEQQWHRNRTFNTLSRKTR